MTRLNRARREHRALQRTHNLTFGETDNPQLQSYVKRTGESRVWCVVNWDGHGAQAGWVQTPWHALALAPGTPMLCRDLLSGETYRWEGDWNFVALDPARWPMHLLEVTRA